MKSKTLLILLAVLLPAGAAGWWIYYQTLPVAVMDAARRGTAMRIVPANIVVSESFDMAIKSEAGGRIVASHVQLGREVKAGEVLYQIDTRDLELEIERMESEYKALKARIAIGSATRFEIATAEENVRNNTRLVEQGRVAPIDLERSRRAVGQLRDRLAHEEIDNRQALESHENTLKLKRRMLEKMSVTVANDGTIAEIFARAGDLVGGGQVLARVISRERLVQAQISEENFAGVRPGLPASVQFLGYGGRLFKAEVERVLPNADEKSRRYIAYLKVDMADELLVPGLTGEAGITVDRHENALLADRRGVPGGSVFTVRDGRARLRPVRTGFAGLDYVEILDGLADGEAIIIDPPPSGFRDGQRVRVAKAPGRR
ncbi:MAG: efflux RND transporter periplasmic adaptor subunit [Opitutaceae bacterium]|jgi:RND family efflux transporter MFP subunit|nr:efflux RND transporter periplasmic adaptor subunit [Opitutaceae bacterium]